MGQMMKIGGLAAAFVVSGAASAAQAGVVNGTADGYGVSADLSLLLLDLNVGPAALSSGIAPAPFTGSESVATLSASTLGLASLSTGVLSGSSMSDVDGLAGLRMAGATGTVDDISASVLLGNIVGLGATTIGSNAQVSGEYGSLSATGGSVLEDLSLSVLGNPLAVDANAGPNTVLFNALGILVVLNEQIVTGDGVASVGMEVNAIHISFTDVAAGLGLLNGDLVIGHSSASMLAVVPAPASGGILATLGMFAAGRRRRSC